MALMWVFTVATLTNRAAAISGLLLPSPTSASTSASRGVREGNRATRAAPRAMPGATAAAAAGAGGAEVRELTMRAPTSGAKVDCPLATARTAAASSARPASFVR